MEERSLIATRHVKKLGHAVAQHRCLHLSYGELGARLSYRKTRVPLARLLSPQNELPVRNAFIHETESPQSSPHVSVRPASAVAWVPAAAFSCHMFKATNCCGPDVCVCVCTSLAHEIRGSQPFDLLKHVCTCLPK